MEEREMIVDDALTHALILCGLATAGTWAVSVVTRECSWVDRLWSVLPPVYVGIFAVHAPSPRLWLLLALTTAWGARLTFNFWRKGGYAPGGEDYRWQILRDRMSPALFQLFNATFISPYQNLLLLLIALPAWSASLHPAPLGAADLGLAAAFLACLVGETVADQQQWRFHLAKRAAAAQGTTLEPPFLTTGLWRWSRHPNFFFEQAQWWLVYGFAVVASGDWVHPSLAGPVLLTLLFDGSTRFTESITAAKYPAYAQYQRTTSRWLPRPGVVRGPSTYAGADPPTGK